MNMLTNPGVIQVHMLCPGTNRIGMAAAHELLPREKATAVNGFKPVTQKKSHGKNLALTVSFVPNSLDSGPEDTLPRPRIGVVSDTTRVSDNGHRGRERERDEEREMRGGGGGGGSESNSAQNQKRSWLVPEHPRITWQNCTPGLAGELARTLKASSDPPKHRRPC